MSIRWGIIGCGDVTERKSGLAFQQAKGSCLVAVMRRNAALAKDYAERHRVPKWYCSSQELIDDPSVDAVYIATPPNAHMPIALACAKARKPTYVEKPMALNFEECRRMVEAFAEANTPLFVAYYRRSLPRFLSIKSLVDEGRIGQVRLVNVHLRKPISEEERRPDALPWRVRPEIAGGGRFVDLASHTLDFLDFTLGPIAYATGIAKNQAGLYPAEDSVVASFAFESGAVGSGSWSFVASDREDRVELIGTDGFIRFSTFGDDPIELCSKATKEALRVKNPDPIQLPHVQSVVDELLGLGACPSTGHSGSRTNWVMDRILKGE